LERQDKLNNKDYIMWAVLLLAGIIYLTFGITHESLWYDESYSAAIINHSIGDIWSIAGSDSHPPLYFIVLKMFTVIFGKSEFGLRLFSCLGIIALSSLGLGPIRKLFGKKTGLVYSFIVLIIPIDLSMAQETRMYSWASFLVAACALYGYIAVSKGQKSDFIKFGLCTIIAAYTHYYALLAVTIINIIIFASIIIKKRSVLKPYLVTATVSLITYLPWLFYLSKQYAKVSKDFWIPTITWETIFNTIVFPYANKFEPNSSLALILPYLTASIVIWAFVYSIVKRRREWKMAAFGLAVYLMTVASGVAASFLIRPVFVERYSVPVIGLLMIPIAYGISLFNKKWLIAAVCILITAFCVPQIVMIEKEHYNGPMYDVKEYLADKINDQDIIIHTDEHTFGTFCYYFPNNKHYMYLGPYSKGYSGFDAFLPTGKSVSDIESITSGNKSIWLVTRLYSSGESAFYALLGSGDFISTGESKDFLLPYSWYGVKVEKVTRQ